MGKIYCKIDMEKVEKIINQKGFYFICTKVLYPDFVGPKYIIVSDDPDIAVKHPKTQGMIIVSVDKFASMAEEYNRYYANDVKHLRRIERSYEEEGYSENVVEDENGNLHGYTTTDDCQSVEDMIESKEEKELLLKAIEGLTPLQKERIRLSYFEKLSHREIAEKQGVSQCAVTLSIEGAEKKLKKFFEKAYQNASPSSL